MPRLTLPIFALWLGALTGALHAAADGWKLPPLDGSMAGEFVTDLLPGAPAVQWSVNLSVPRPGVRGVRFAVDGRGTRLRGEATLDPKGDGTWRVTEAQLDLGTWWAVLGSKFLPMLPGLTVTGTIGLDASGTVAGGQIAGRAEIDMRDVAVADSAKGWSLTGLSLGAKLGRLPELALDEPVRLRFREASIAGIVLREGAADFVVKPDGVVHVANAGGRLLDGRIALRPFSVGGPQKVLRTTLEFFSVELSGLGKFLPAALRDARGPVSGRIDVSWELGDGLKLANGSIHPDEQRPASITLAPTPGFLTERLPVRMRERFDLLPEWLGPMRLWFAPVNPAYAILRSIEMGERALEITTLDLALSPDGDGRGRTAHVVVMTRPAGKASEVGSVRFELNVSGPLAEFVRLLSENRVNIRVR